MKRHLVIWVSATVALILVGAIPIARRFRLSVLSPSELTAKRLTPPTPPDDTCDQIQRILAGSPNLKPVRSTNPLSADDVAIYQDVLERWNSGSPGLLNVSNRTYPIEREVREFPDCGCLKGIEVQSIANAARSFHVLTTGLLRGRAIRLVDADKQAVIVRTNDPDNSMREGKSVETAVRGAFSAGLFSMSEVVFDKDHRRALVSYSFVCGSLCGSGGVWLFEKVDGVWKKLDRVCGGWVS